MLASSCDQDDSSKKKYEPDVEIAFWYKINPNGLSPLEKRMYSSALEKFKARERIHLMMLSRMSPDGVYDTYMAAFDDPARAEQARAKQQELVSKLETR